MNTERLMALCELLMCLDPWPLKLELREHLVDLANEESLGMGFDDWIAFYHAH